MKRFLLLIAAALIMDASGIHAQQSSGSDGSYQDPKELSDSIVVTANRSGTPLREIASSVTIITREEIERSQAVMLSDLLRTVPGVDIVQSGGVGSITSAFLRGANSNHTLVLLDGIKLNDPSSPSGAVDFSNLRVDDIERVEILRGPQSVLYGSDAIGGVIQLFTKEGAGKPSLTISSEVGSFGTVHEQLDVSGSANRLGYSVSIARLDTDGISSADIRDGAAERDGYGNTLISTRMRFKVSDAVTLRLSGRYTDDNSDIDKTSGVLDDPNFTLEMKEQQYLFGIDFAPAKSVWSHKFHLTYTDIERISVDEVDAEHADNSQRTYFEGDRIKFDWIHSLVISKNNKLLMGIETERESFSGDLFFRSLFGDFVKANAPVNAWTRGIFALEQFDINSRLFVTLGGRLDKHKQFGTVGSYRATAAYLFSDLGTKIRGNVGRGFKAPSLAQLYDATSGNPDLVPEESLGWELGIDQPLFGDKFSFSVVYFDNQIKNLIQSNQNVANASANGIEAAISFSIPIVQARIDYTYTNSKDELDGSELIRRPKTKAAINVSVTPANKFRFNLSGRYVGARDDIDFRTFPFVRVRLDAYTVFDIAGSYDLSNSVKLFMRADNLFDEEYQEVLTYGNIPLSVHGGIRVKL